MLYNVYLWSGAGYQLKPFENIEASCEEEALDLAVVQAERNGWTGLFWDEVEDVEQLEEQGEVIYIDATIEGANEVHYIDATNARIEEVKA